MNNIDIGELCFIVLLIVQKDGEPVVIEQSANTSNQGLHLISSYQWTRSTIEIAISGGFT